MKDLFASYNKLEQIGGLIKQARINADYTQSQLAEVTGLSIKAVRNAENGHCNLESFAVILLALDLDLHSLLKNHWEQSKVSPIAVSQQHDKKPRQRASGATHSSKDNLEW